MKILLLGKNGQVGWELQRSLVPLGELVSLHRQSKNYCGDLADPQGLATTIRALRPDVVVNAAAYTAVDKAESEPELAHRINAEAVEVMARETKRLGAWLVHYSTDYVFNGEGNVAWCEGDEVAPLSQYGTSKLNGEKAIQTSGCRHLIFRTSWVYAARGNNFAKTMLHLGQQRENLDVIDDQFGAPSGGELIADVTAHALRAATQAPHLCGLYHLTASGETTWCRYARFVLERAQASGLRFKVKPVSINAIDSDAYPVAAKRPKNSRLSTTKLQQAFGLKMPTWEAGVARMLDEVLENQQ